MQHNRPLVIGRIDLVQVTFLFLLMSASFAYAGGQSGVVEPDTWTIGIAPQVTHVTYDSTSTRANMTSAGMSAWLQYLESGGLALSAARTELRMRQNSSIVYQSSGSLSGYWNLTPDFLPGRVTLRAEVLGADNNDTTNETNGVRVLAQQISFLNYAKSFYLDMGYASSVYGESNAGNGKLAVSQWTPTVGIGLNEGADWFQLRGYAIRVSNAARAQNNSGTDALDVKWTHYFAPSEWLPEQIQVGALFGPRIYAVDSGNIYNLADIQLGGASLGMQWQLEEGLTLLLQGGQDRYDAGNGVVYSGTYGYAGVSSQW